MNDIMKIVNSLEESCLLIKIVSQTIENEAKEQTEGFLGMSLRTLGGSLLENLLIHKEVIATSQWRKANIPGQGTITAGEGIIRTGQDF